MDFYLNNFITHPIINLINYAVNSNAINHKMSAFRYSLNANNKTFHNNSIIVEDAVLLKVISILFEITQYVNIKYYHCNIKCGSPLGSLSNTLILNITAVILNVVHPWVLYLIKVSYF